MSQLYNFCAIDLLRSEENQASHEQIPKDIPKQEEFSSALQQCEALVDIRIESFGHRERVTWIQDFDSGLGKIGLVIDGTQSQLPLYDGLHQQEG